MTMAVKEVTEAVRQAIEAVGGKPPNWEFKIEYVDADGVVVHDSGRVYAAESKSVYKYVAAKYRAKSVSGFFRALQVLELDTEGGYVIGKEPEQYSIIEQVQDKIEERLAATKAAGKKGKPKGEPFDTKPCFMYRYMLPIVTADSKQHEFYKVVPHT